MNGKKAVFHLPGLFEFYGLYSVFLPLFRDHREYFYDLCEIGSIYGAPEGCIWGGGRVGSGTADPRSVLKLTDEYGISPRLTFSNSLLRHEHLSDTRCNSLCSLFERSSKAGSGVIVHSELLLNYLSERYPKLYFISSTTKVITDYELFIDELNRPEFDYVVPDFRLNRRFDRFAEMTESQKNKVELLCNECCFEGCTDRRACYENVSRKTLGEDCADHICTAPGGRRGYRFSEAMKNPFFIGKDDIYSVYLPMGFSNFKIEGRGLGSATVFEMLLYYTVKPEFQIKVREEVYLDPMLDLF